MSRSRYYPGRRYDPGDRAEWYAYKRRREDIATGVIATRIPARRKKVYHSFWGTKAKLLKRHEPLITTTPRLPREMWDPEEAKVQKAVRDFFEALCSNLKPPATKAKKPGCDR